MTIASNSYTIKIIITGEVLSLNCFSRNESKFTPKMVAAQLPPFLV